MIFSLTTGVLSFLVTVAIGYPLVRFLRAQKMGKAISRWGPASHQNKAGTPTMGGLMIVVTVGLAILVSYLVAPLADRARGPSIFLPLAVMVAMGFLGLWDDLLTLQGGTRRGLSWRLKFGALTAVALGAAFILYDRMEIHGISVPWLGQYDMGPAYIAVAVLAIVATTSAVAVTDGLDALAGGTTAIAFSAYGIIAFLQEQTFLITFCFAAVGANLGFLWYNAHPAQVFMGDTGALALGSTLAVVALMTGHWLILPIIGVVFVLEGLSDVLQIAYFRWTGGKRIFRMSPLHHHFELLGWSEPQVVLRFWLLGFLGAMLGVAMALSV